MQILLSAGHTNKIGQDRGAAGNGYIEGVETVRLRDKTAEYLRALNPNVTVIEDGADGDNEPLTKAVELARKSDVAIEYHFNAGSEKASGVEVLSKPQNKKLAQRIGVAVYAALSIPIRGDMGWKSDDSGQHHRLAFCEAGGIIVEVCFISNASDMFKYSANFQWLCENIAGAINFHLGELTPAGSVAGQTAQTNDKPQTSPQYIPAVTSYNLKKGDKNEFVRALQVRLFQKDFLLRPDIDGVFGEKTHQAVINFQYAHGLRTDGRVGNETAKALGLL